MEIAGECGSGTEAIATIRRETQSLLWPAVTFVYMTAVAYTAALLVYQGATAVGL